MFFSYVITGLLWLSEPCQGTDTQLQVVRCAHTFRFRRDPHVSTEPWVFLKSYREDPAGPNDRRDTEW